MRIQSLLISCVALFTSSTALVACTGEQVDLGRNFEAGVSFGAEAMVDAPTAPEGGGGSSLSVAITSSTGMWTICAGDCVKLLAITNGGTGPFSYAWGPNLGEGAGPQLVCPTVTTTYAVLVSSLSTPQQSSGSQQQITVVPCDAGVITPPPQDASTMQGVDSGTGTTGTMSLCINNASFEGMPTIGTPGTPATPPTAAPPGWQVCQGDPDIDPSVSLVPANDGMTYVGLSVGTGNFSYLTEALGTTLCAPLMAGVHYSFCLDLAVGVRGVSFSGNPLMMPPGAPTPVLDVWGGTAACAQEEPLFISQGITNVDSWSKVCGTFMPSRNLTTLTIAPSLTGSTMGAPLASYVIVDHITSP
jgi:hypothetical protein